MFLGQMLISQKMSDPLEAQTMNEYSLIHSLRNRRCFHKNTQNVLNLSTSFSGDCLPWPKKLWGESDHKILVENLEMFLKFGVTTKF
jgi:hypothetical protein